MIITLPTYIDCSSKKRWAVNLNEYRNSHYQTLNKVKVKFKEMVKSQILALPYLNKIEIEYVLYAARNCDVANVCSVADKFFSDALTELGRIEDDCVRFVSKVSYSFGGFDKTNPRIEAHITELEPKEEEQMQITLNQDEIMLALESYVRSQITIAENQQITIDLKAGRGENGYSATLDISPRRASTAVAAAPVAQQAAITATPENREPVEETVTEDAAEESTVKPNRAQALLADVTEDAPAAPPRKGASIFGTAE